MIYKREWTKKEDQVLIFLREDINITKINKWSEIAKLMKIEFGQHSRNEKQCRNRYINQLRLNTNLNIWDKEKQDRLVLLHRELGNKWVLIAGRLNGVTQNFVKNKFYARLRKSVRTINKRSRQIFKKQYKPFKLNLIFKLSSIVDGKLSNNLDIQAELSSSFTDLLYIIVSLSQEPLQAVMKQLNCEQQLLMLVIAPLISLQKIISSFAKNNSKKPQIPIFRSNSQVEKLKSQLHIYELQLVLKKSKLISKVKGQLKQLLSFYRITLFPSLILLQRSLGEIALHDSLLISTDPQRFIQILKCSVSIQKNIMTGMYKNKESIDKLISFNCINNIFYQLPECNSEDPNEESQIIQVQDAQSAPRKNTMDDPWQNTFQSLLHTVYDQ